MLIQRHGITGPQLIVLREISVHGPITAGELAQRVALSKGTVSGILDRLENRGLVQRQRDCEDRRHVRVHATEQCEELLKDAPSPLQAQFISEFNALNDWEQHLMLSTLQRIVAMMQADEIDAGAVLTTGPIAATEQQLKQSMEP